MARDKLEAYLGIALGTLAVTFGTFMALDNWAIMQQIQAQGLVGQAFAQEEYRQAANNVKLFGTAAALGFVFLIIAAGQYVSGTLSQIAN